MERLQEYLRGEKSIKFSDGLDVGLRERDFNDVPSAFGLFNSINNGVIH